MPQGPLCQPSGAQAGLQLPWQGSLLSAAGNAFGWGGPPHLSESFELPVIWGAETAAELAVKTDSHAAQLPDTECHLFGVDTRVPASVHPAAVDWHHYKQPTDQNHTADQASLPALRL